MLLKILLIDYQKDTINKMIRCLSRDVELLAAETISAGEKYIRQQNPNIILLEPGTENADSFIQNHCSDFKNAPLILFASDIRTEYLVKAVKNGVSEYISKRTDIPVVLSKIRSVHMQNETRLMKNSVPAGLLDFITGESKKINSVKQLISKYAASSYPVLISGESGTGKDLAARAIHILSHRKEFPYIPVNCGAIPATLLESELFGCEKGAFTDAVNKPGLFEASSDGTVFLDEIGEMPAASQVKLLRVIEEKHVQRLGSNFRKPVNIRVVSATNADLQNLVEKKEFRADLFYRLNVLNIRIPPLRERKEDIPLLTAHLLKENRINKSFTSQAVSKLFAHSWPGNIRELRNVIIRAAVMSEGETVGAEHIQFV